MALSKRISSIHSSVPITPSTDNNFLFSAYIFDIHAYIHTAKQPSIHIYMRPHPYPYLPFLFAKIMDTYSELKLNKGKIKQTNKQKMYICELALPSSSFPISQSAPAPEPHHQPTTIGRNQPTIIIPIPLAKFYLE